MRRHGPVIAHCTDSEDFPVPAAGTEYIGWVMLFNASNARKLHYTLQSDSDVINASAVCSVLISYGL